MLTRWVLGRYITDSDLEFFKDRIEREVDVGARAWDHVLTKSENDWTYTAWRGIMPVCSCACLLFSTYLSATRFASRSGDMPPQQ